MFGRRGPPPDPLKERLRKISEDAARPPKPLAKAQPDKPRSERASVFRNATLVVGEGQRMAVVIKDLSESGARIEFFVQSELPDRVMLIEPLQKLKRSARVVWQRAGIAGLVFDD